jgi:hypothetical protein
MRNILIAISIILFYGCATTNPIPAADTTKPVIRYDTIIRTDTIIKLAYIYQDTTGVSGIVKVFPLPGDNADNIQAAVNFCIANACEVELVAGYYLISKPIIFAVINGLDYGQVSIDISGPQDCQDAPDRRMAIIAPTFKDRPAFAIQSGKGVKIKNLCFKGQYLKPNFITPYSIQTMRYSDWSDSTVDDYYAAIVIDPFSNSDYEDLRKYKGMELYYLKGMSRSGSTGVDVIGCKIINFSVGILYEPTYQQNGDLCNVNHCTIEYCKVGISYCQDQTKGDYVRNLRVWGNVHTVIATGLHGRGIGCMPFIDGMNVAGGVYELFYCPSSGRFTAGAYNIYAEMLFKIGFIGGRPMPGIYNSTFDFMDFGWSPDFYVYGAANFSNCQFRIYNEQVNKLLIPSFAGTFSGGTMEQPMTSGIFQGGVYSDTPRFFRVRTFDTDAFAGKAAFYDGRINDSAIILDRNIPGQILSIDSVNYQATVLLKTSNATVKEGDYLLAGLEWFNYYDNNLLSPIASTVQVGRIKALHSDTAILDQVSISMLARNGQNIYFYKSK